MKVVKKPSNLSELEFKKPDSGNYLQYTSVASQSRCCCTKNVLKIGHRFFVTVPAFVRVFGSTITLILVPILTGLGFHLVDPAAMTTDPGKCGFVLIVMALYWVTTTFPVAVTALIPLAAFPLLGLMGTVTKKSAKIFFNF